MGAIPWKTYSSMSRGAEEKRARRRNERFRARPGRPDRVLATARGRHGAALLVSFAILLGPADGADLLARRADVDVGLPADLSREECRLFRSGGRYVHRRRVALGHPLPGPARLFHLVP